MRDSILRNLQVMLNSRHGGSPTVPDFGTSDFSDYFQGYDSIQIFKQEIRRTIEKYEPRLTDVFVEFTPMEDDPHRVHFEISALIRTEDQEVATVFRTIVEGSGEVRVRYR